MVMPWTYPRGQWETTPWPLNWWMPCYRRTVRMPEGDIVWEYSI